MAQFEYKVVPAPVRAEKIRGLKTVQERFAATLAAVMNELGREGWEYVRADTLPVEERVGFTGRQNTFQNMLIFRRVIADVVVETPVIGVPGPRLPEVRMSGGAAAAPPPAPPVDWPVNSAAPSLGPARPLAAE
jgi:hypothetical protein